MDEFLFSNYGFSFPLDICPGVGLLDLIVVLVLAFFFFKGNFILFFIRVVPICIPTNSIEGIPFLHTLSAFIVCRLFDAGPSDWCVVIPHCSFDLHFYSSGCWTSFHVLFGCVSSLGKCIFLSSAHFFDWIACLFDLSCMSCLYFGVWPLVSCFFFFFYLWWILSHIEMKQPWLYMCSPSFANIFSHSMGYLSF